MIYYCPFCDIEIDYSWVPPFLTDEAKYLHSCGNWVDFRFGNNGPDAVIREPYRGGFAWQRRRAGPSPSPNDATYRIWSRRQERLEDEHYATMVGYVWCPIITSFGGFALVWLIVAEPSVWHLVWGAGAGLMLGMLISPHVTVDVSRRLGQARDELRRKIDREMHKDTQEH